MIIECEKRYNLKDLSFSEIEVICLGLDEIVISNLREKECNIAKEVRNYIDEFLKGDCKNDI